MTDLTPERRASPFEADMFRGPVRLDRLVSLLRLFPAPVGSATLAALAIGGGLLTPSRFESAVAWAAARGIGRWRRHCLALQLLANHGRFVAEESMIGLSVSDLVRSLRLEGDEHLASAAGGTLLLGFHLGAPKTWLALRALGHDVRLVGNLSASARDPRWQRAIEEDAAIDLQGDMGNRVAAMYRVQRLLRQKQAVLYLTADGPFGQEAFRIDLAGGPVIIRQGWLSLRRLTGVRVLPVTAHRAGRQRVVTIHPPLPPVLADPTADATACREVLTPLVSEFVRRFPSQCRWLAMPRWSTAVPSPRY